MFDEDDPSRWRQRGRRSYAMSDRRSRPPRGPTSAGTPCRSGARPASGRLPATWMRSSGGIPKPWREAGRLRGRSSGSKTSTATPSVPGRSSRRATVESSKPVVTLSHRAGLRRLPARPKSSDAARRSRTPTRRRRSPTPRSPRPRWPSTASRDPDGRQEAGASASGAGRRRRPADRRRTASH